MTEENKIRDAADAIKGVVEAIPVYQDVVQPAAKELGTALQTVAKTLHIVLAPISALVWGYDRVKDFVSHDVAKKLEGVPVEELGEPEPHVAGPALEALRYTGYQEELRELYANLLATSIDMATATQAHPAFVEMIKQISPDEARIVRLLARRFATPMIDVRREEKESRLGTWVVRNFTLLPLEANCAAINLGPIYLNNLQRLGIVELREDYRLRTENEDDTYRPLESHADIVHQKTLIESDNASKATIGRGAVQLTELGVQFCQACVLDGTHDRGSA